MMLSLVLLLTIIVVSVESSAQRIHVDGEVSLLANLSDVHQIEKDLRGEGSLLFSDGYSIKMIDDIPVEDDEAEEVFSKGNSSDRFLPITDFIQLDKERIVITDFGSNCLRLVERENGLQEDFVGKCYFSGFRDGTQNVTRFDSPWAIVFNRNQKKILVADRNNHAVRSVDVESRTTTTLLKTGLYLPISIAYDEKNNLLYIANYNYITKYNMEKEIFSTVAGNGLTGYRDGEGRDSEFRSPLKMFLLEEGMLLVADRANSAVRVVDLVTSKVSSICCNKDCKFPQPLCVAKIGEALYIGQRQSITKLRVKVENIAHQCSNDTNKLIQLQGNETKSDVNILGRINLTLPAGNYKQTDKDGCTSEISIKLDAKVVCPENQTLTADKATNQAKLSLFELNGVKQEITLHIGTHDLITIIDGEQCHSTVTIRDGRLKSRLAIEADYNINCTYLKNDEVRKFIMGVADSKYYEISQICPNGTDCSKPNNMAVSLSCKKELKTITITWPTNWTLDSYLTEVPDKIWQEIEHKAADYRHILDVTVFGRIPPVVFPSRNERNIVVRPVIQPFCEDGKIYHTKDRCI